MTNPTVTITATEGKSLIKRHVFRKFSVCKFGRDCDDFLPIPNDRNHLTISRRHCKLIVDPPKVWLTDLGSLNGTRVNGRLIRETTAPIRLHDSDEICLGSNIEIYIDIGFESTDEPNHEEEMMPHHINPNLIVTTQDESLHIGFVGQKVRFGDGHIHLLEQQLTDILPGIPVNEVVLDLGNVECIASLVIAKLLRLKQQLANENIVLRLHGLTPYVQELLHSSRAAQSLGSESYGELVCI